MSDNLPPIRENPAATGTETRLRLAIHERLLPGDTDEARAAAAERLGFAGIEYDAENLETRVPSIVNALAGRDLVAASVHTGWTHDALSADEPTRQHALDRLREAFALAVDIGAPNVVMVPQPSRTLDLPDLMPFKSPIQLALELMVWHLRGYSDLAYVFGVKLMLHPVNRYESAFLNTLEQGVELRRRVKFSRHVWLAADSFQMTTAEPDPVTALTTHAEHVGMVYLADNTGGLPGTGMLDFAALRAGLPDEGGWAVVRSYHVDDAPSMRALHDAVSHLRESGF
ncbi:MAG: sugar phosphate isomerase/epimerase family protein [Chloroflexota bacterium]